MVYKCYTFGCKSRYVRKNDEHDDAVPVVSYLSLIHISEPTRPY